MKPPYVMENGGMYLTKREFWERKQRIGYVATTVVMHWWESIEIDDLFDLAVARALAPVIEAFRRNGAI